MRGISFSKSQEAHTRNTEALATEIVKTQCHNYGENINAVTVVRALGYLVLAVVEAGAYILKPEYSFNRYLEMYRAHREGLLRNTIIMDRKNR